MTATEPVQRHSTLVGGSTAARLIACPGSYKLSLQVPDDDRSSIYASEGTALHSCMDYILENDIADAQDVLGKVFTADGIDFEMTQDLIDECIAPALEFFDHLMDLAEAEGGAVFLVEREVHMPGIPGAFGRCDVIARTDKRTIILDWKFGGGVYVSPKENAQGQFYGRAAMHSFPDYFEDDPDWPVEIMFCQPRLNDLPVGEWIKHARWSTTVKELEDFRMTLVRAVAEATGDDGRIEDGPHCRFARCRAICPRHLDSAAGMANVAERLTALKQQAEGDVLPLEYGEKLALGLQLKAMLEPMFAEITKQAHEHLEGGGDVPGYKLVAKRANRTWIDEAKAERALAARGLSVKQRREVKLISPAKADKALAKVGEAFDEKTAARLIEAVSSGTTIAPVEDARQAIETSAASVKALADKITRG